MNFLAPALVLLVGLFVLKMDVIDGKLMGLQGSRRSVADTPEVGEKKAVHTTSGSFGGVNNAAHPGGAKAAANGEGIAFEDILIPKSNVGHAIPSLNRANLVNLVGHYMHDEHRSPYASHLYEATKEELDERQKKYIEKMAKVREEWGAWDFRDPRDDQKDGKTTTPGKDDKPRLEADFSKAQYKDLPSEDFPPTSWQADEDYVARFIEEGKNLVHRVKEGIYAEIGWPKKGSDEATLEKRDKILKINILDPDEAVPKEGLVSMQFTAFDALVKKLLHGMMTNDDFYAVLAGHSAAAGHGNDFMQNRIMMFHNVMEPVFDKLGMRLISRNMGMGGVGTLQFSLAGGDLYGETDILEWDSGMTERGAPVDMFNKQAILSGERVPIIMTNQPFDIMTETDGLAWIGTYNEKATVPIFPDTTFENAASQPYAARWFNQKEEKYNAICWEPRSDFKPLKPQKKKPSSQVGWHPGNRHHQWQGRRLALVLLEALGAAFERWEESIGKDGLPLAASHWHVGDSYKVVRETLRTHINTPKPDENEGPRSKCENMYPDIPRICRVQMHGYGMWTPRAHPDYDFLNLIHEAPNGYKPDYLTKNAYDGFDLMPLNQAVPDGEVDVHAIAIATTSPAPDIDHSWIEEEEDSSELPPPTRRWLREASEIAFRKGAEAFPQSTNVVKNRLLLSETGKEEESVESSSASDDKSVLRRNLKIVEIVPGRGWEMHGWNTVKGFADGSAQSEYKRGEIDDCMLYGANDNHLDLYGNTLSGWLVFTVPKVREGVILVRTEWWCGSKVKNQMTQDWTEVNNGMTADTTPWNATSMDVEDKGQHRILGKASKDALIPKDFEMDYVVNGEMKTMQREEWVTQMKEEGKNVAVVTILNDISMAEKDFDGEDITVGIRFRSELMPQQQRCVSHVYYA